jgi:hypothetical protein
VTFESGSRLERIEASACEESGLKSILIPSSVVVLGEGSFYECKSLESVTFESRSRLQRIEASAFYGSGLKSIEIPGSVTFIDSSAFLATPVARGGGGEEEGEEEEEEEVGEEEAVLELAGGFDDIYG